MVAIPDLRAADLHYDADHRLGIRTVCVLFKRMGSAGLQSLLSVVLLDSELDDRVKN